MASTSISSSHCSSLEEMTIRLRYGDLSWLGGINRECGGRFENYGKNWKTGVHLYKLRLLISSRALPSRCLLNTYCISEMYFEWDLKDKCKVTSQRDFNTRDKCILT